MKRILVPCDFSAASEKAVNFAIDLADKEDELFLLNLINDTSQELSLQIKAVELRFKNLIDGFPNAAIPIYPKILSGKFLSSILNFIKDEKIDLIVMGTRGSRGWDGFFIGSNIEKIVRTSPIPVFAVRGSVNPRFIHDIVVPCNLKLDQPEIILKVKELQRLFHSRLHLLRVNTRKSQNIIEVVNSLNEYAKHYQLSDYTISVSNDANIKDGILRFAREINADMVAMVTRGKRDLRRMFTESATADIVNHANILVWTCTS